MKILIAEDNAFYRRMLEATLHEWGYDVVLADNGDSAWQILEGRDPPKIALVDWLMPGLDGLELCRKIRAKGSERPTYVIILTAKGGKDNIIAGLEAGADDYINKPFYREELHARLQVGLRIVGLQSSLAARVRELEEALSGAQKMEAIGRLAGGVAHDFNNLLTIIIGYSEVLQNALPPGDGLATSVAEIIKAGERATTLTRQLLTFSRKQVVTPVVLDLNRVAANVERMLRRLIGEDINLVTVTDSAPVLVKADPGQVEQVIMNLAVNARDAMPSGGNLTITVSGVEATGDSTPSLPPGSYSLLMVSDTGCGMADEIKSHIFEPFFTTKEVGKGTGLGLATVYGIVKQGGGCIQVDSQVGVGTTFKIYLPRSAESPLPAPEPPAKVSSNTSGKETVLLVEDEDAVRLMACTALQAKGYTVLEAADGREALRLGLEFPSPIHLLLTDVVIPEVSGRELASRLRAQRPKMKVLFMSGYIDDTGDYLRVQESGMPFLQKPFTPVVLSRRVREVLGG